MRPLEKDMTWETVAKNGPVINARKRWEQQEHERRCKLLGEVLAEDWREVVADLAEYYDGMVPQWLALQLMEDAYEMGKRE
jgi:hypothetical protein